MGTHMRILCSHDYEVSVAGHLRILCNSLSFSGFCAII